MPQCCDTVRIYEIMLDNQKSILFSSPYLVKRALAVLMYYSLACSADFPAHLVQASHLDLA